MKTLFFFSLLFAITSLSAQSVSYTYDASGNRTARVINLSASPQLRASEEATPLEDLLAERKIKIYPNPTKGMLAVEIIDFTEEIQGEYFVYDMSGRMLKREKAAPGKVSLDLSNQPNGVYLLRINLNGESVTWKIVKE